MRFIESLSTYRDALILARGFILRGLPYRFLTTLEDIALAPDDFVFGSLPFMKRAFAKQKVQPPAPFDYFDLQDFLHRTVWPGEFGDIAWTDCPVFCKPRLEYKAFTGSPGDRVRSFRSRPPDGVPTRGHGSTPSGSREGI